MGFLRADKKVRERWLNEGQKKIVVAVPSLQELFAVKEKAEKLSIPTAVVRDAGLTEIPPGTVTALALGPDDERRIDRVTGNLPLLR